MEFIKILKLNSPFPGPIVEFMDPQIINTVYLIT